MPISTYRRVSIMLVVLVVASFLLGYQLASAAPRAIASPEVPGWLRAGLQFLRFEAPENENGIKERDINILYDVFDKIDGEYIDADKIDSKKVIYGAASGAVDALGDPYSRFVPPAPSKEMKADIEGYYYGVGVTIEERKGHVIIINVFPESPAEQAGLAAGDIISSVDGEEVLTAGSLRVVELIRGPENTTVQIGVLREGNDEELVYTVNRVNIKYPSVWESKMLDGEIGYALVTQFSKETPEDLRKAIEELKSEGAKALILDLRNNGGGPLDAAVYVGDLFIPEGAIVYLQDKDGNLHPDPVDRPMTKRGEAAGMPLVVMINQFSASASEIVAGAIQDYKAGEVIGQKSFGKGVVQNVIRLSDGSSLVLTTNKYLTPNKRDINEVGIEPDIPISLELKDIQDEYIVDALNKLKSLDDEIKAKNEELRDYLKGHDFQLDIAKKYLYEKIAAG